MSPDQSDTTPHGMVLTYDFKLRRQVGRRAGWLTFLVDRGAGKDEELEEVALVVFAVAGDEDGREACDGWSLTSPSLRCRLPRWSSP